MINTRFGGFSSATDVCSRHDNRVALVLAGHKHGVEKQTEAADHDDCQQVTDDDLRTKLQKVLTEVERFQSLSMVDRLQSDDVLRSKRISRPQPWLNDTVRLASKENVSFVRLKFAEN